MERTTTGAVVDALTLPVRFLGGSLVERDDARVTVEENAYRLALERPGHDPDCFDVTWRAGELVVATTCGDGVEEESFRFPEIVDPADIDATYREERLVVRLPVRGRTATETVAAAQAD